MQVKPIVKYKPPVYPAREEIIKDPKLLKTLPERWKGNAYAAAAMSLLLIMTLTSCGSQNIDAGSTESPSKGQAAPIFVHGDGRGSFGCESVAPPAFLSEEEAFTVIAEEAKREGIIFTSDGPTLKNVIIPKTDTFYEQEDTKEVEGVKGDLVLDGADNSKNIAFEFVSHDDIESWLDKNSGRMSTVETFRFFDTAETLSGGMQDKTGSFSVATFYDPSFDFGSQNTQDIIKNNKDDYKGLQEKLKDQVKNDLREQVRDFLSWLKGQGII
jgi:hypothetical protein